MSFRPKELANLIAGFQHPLSWVMFDAVSLLPTEIIFSYFYHFNYSIFAIFVLYSFNMAFNYPEAVGQVDVISDSKVC